MTKLQDLIDLAKEPSSAKRRVLLREVTDLFFSNPDHRTGELSLFDDVLTQLAGEMEEAVRVELAVRLAPTPSPPFRLVRKLAADAAIAVAQPILEASPALTDEDLVAVARKHGQAHLKAISRRSQISEAVSDVIVERGDDETLGVLLHNDGARLSRQAHEAAVDRAGANPALQEAVVSRRDLPIDLLNDMYFAVEAKLRTKILERNAAVDPEALEAALAAGRNRVATQDGALPDDYEAAERDVRSMVARKALTPKALASMLRNRESTRFMVALAELAGIDFHTARVILERRELDALAIVCKAADFERSLFLTFAVLVLDRDSDPMGRAKKYGDLYAELPKESAQRTIRFWRMRRQSPDMAA
ncbi:MAG TPA: DUF2336 domain-containing protein [Caulobacteraceae bacterium]|jgi:uncharacterized protein (DUF2336 family)|nr:DUF2336 domain-containing protein [Caulobacteraceae bacterium]